MWPISGAKWARVSKVEITVPTGMACHKQQPGRRFRPLQHAGRQDVDS